MINLIEYIIIYFILTSMTYLELIISYYLWINRM